MAGDTASREYIVQVTAEEAVRGVRVGLQLRLVGICEKCNGSRSELGYTSTGPGRQSSDSAYTAEQMYQTIFGQKATEEGQEEHAHEDFAESMAGDTASREYIVQVTA